MAETVHYHVEVGLRSFFKTTPPEIRSEFLGNGFKLDFSGNIQKEHYIEHKMPTRLGADFMLKVIVQGLAGVIDYGKQKGWWTHEEMFIRSGQDLRHLLGAIKEDAKYSAEAYDSPQNGNNQKKSTNKELVVELLRRNKEGAYDEIIRMAEQNYFHDFKQPDNCDTPPKAYLAAVLAAFPELYDLREQVINGDYDEDPDEEDNGKMWQFIQENFFPKT